METVKDKLDRLNDLTEEQIQNTDSFSKEIEKLNDTGSALTTVVKKSTSDLFGGLFLAGIMGSMFKMKELRLQQTQVAREARRDLLEENKKEIDEEIRNFLRDKAKTKELVELHITERLLIPHIIEANNCLCELFNTSTTAFLKDRTGLEIILEVIKQSLEKHGLDEFANQFDKEVKSSLENKYKVERIVRSHVEEEFLENFKM